MRRPTSHNRGAMTGTMLATLGLIALAGCGDGGRVDGQIGQTTPPELECDVTFSVDTAGEFGEIFFEVSFADAPGVFRGLGELLECEPLVAEAVLNLRNHLGDSPPSAELSISVVHAAFPQKLTVDADLVRCVFDADEAPVAADIVVERALVGEGGPAIEVAVTAIDCHPFGVTSTSTTSSTSVTLEDPCLDVACPPGEACFAGTCDTIDRYELDLSVIDEVTLGALQFDVDVASAPGVFLHGLDDRARCTRNPELRGGFESTHRCARPDHCTDVAGHAEGSIVVAETSAIGIEGPVVVTTCEFQSDGTAPVPGDFEITVVDASTPRTEPISPFPRVVVSAIRPILP